jgi:hypothetical protein
MPSLFHPVHGRELHVPAFYDAYMNGREHAHGKSSQAADGPGAIDPAAAFHVGADWVRQVLVPCIERGNAELQSVQVTIELDLNLDPRSTNHAHDDFWLADLGEGPRAVGPKYSINVLGGQRVWLYQAGGQGRELGAVDRCGVEEIETLLLDATEEFGRMPR